MYEAEHLVSLSLPSLASFTRKVRRAFPVRCFCGLFPLHARTHSLSVRLPLVSGHTHAHPNNAAVLPFLVAVDAVMTGASTLSRNGVVPRLLAGDGVGFAIAYKRVPKVMLV